MARELVKTYSHISEEGQKLFAPEREAVGLCPRCGKPVYEGKKNFYCSDRSCRFVLWKDDRFWTSRKKELTRKMAGDLLKKGRTSVKGMWSEKKGAAYDAVVVLGDTGEKYVRSKLEFPKRKEMKKLAFLGMGLCIALAFSSCKSSESAYKKAYEKAKQQELATCHNDDGPSRLRLRRSFFSKRGEYSTPYTKRLPTLKKTDL